MAKNLETSLISFDGKVTKIEGEELHIDFYDAHGCYHKTKSNIAKIGLPRENIVPGYKFRLTVTKKDGKISLRYEDRPKKELTSTDYARIQTEIDKTFQGIEIVSNIE
jgi:hypothetical protein